MEENLKILLEEYSNISDKILSSLQAKDYSKTDKFIKKRQDVIVSLDKLNYIQSEFVEISNKLYLVEKEINLNRLINENRQELKMEMLKLKQGRQVNKNYNKKFAVDSLYFNKKI